MDTKRCQICWVGTTCGEFMGIPMCAECLSHRIEINKDELEKRIREVGMPDDFHFFEKWKGSIPKLKPESEWQWWQGVARSRAYEILDKSIREIERLRISEHDYRAKFDWIFERAMQTHSALLRLRIGFARLSSDIHHYKGISKRVKFWDRVMHNFIFRLDRFNRRWK